MIYRVRLRWRKSMWNSMFSSLSSLILGLADAFSAFLCWKESVIFGENKELSKKNENCYKRKQIYLGEI